MSFNSSHGSDEGQPITTLRLRLIKPVDNGKRSKEPDLVGAALAGAKLRRIAWMGVNLSFADLTGADLRKADLSGANFTTAEMTLADLRGASLRRATLFGTDLFGANLSQADLTDAWLGGADLDEAVLTGAILQNAAYDRETRWPEGFDPDACGAVLVISMGSESAAAC